MFRRLSSKKQKPSTSKGNDPVQGDQGDRPKLQKKSSFRRLMSWSSKKKKDENDVDETNVAIFDASIEVASSRKVHSCCCMASSSIPFHLFLFHLNALAVGAPRFVHRELRHRYLLLRYAFNCATHAAACHVVYNLKTDLGPDGGCWL